MTRVYLLTSFGGEYDDEWENTEAVFSSYAAMTTWIKGKFEQVDLEFISNVLPEITVLDEVYLSGSFKCSEYDEVVYLSGSFKCSEYDEVVGLRYKAYDVIGEVDCKTDKLVFKEI